MSNTLQDIGTERAVIAGICQHGIDAYIDVQDLINVNAFTEIHNQMLWRCLEHVFAAGTSKVDIPSICAAASTLKYTEQITKDKRDQDYIRSLFNFPIHLENVRQHAATLMKLHIARMAQERHQTAYQELASITGKENIDEILSISEKPIFELSNELNNNSTNIPVSFADIADEHLKYLRTNPVEQIGIPTPYPIFNSVIGGGLRTGVTLIAARPKVGKSSMGANVAWHCGNSLNIPVLILDTEMQQKSILEKLWSIISKVDIDLIETGQFVLDTILDKKVGEANTLLKQHPHIYHTRIAGKPFEEVLLILRRWIYKTVGFDENGNTNPHLVIYDYFKLMDDESLKDIAEYQAIGFQISALHDFCGDFNTPVLSFVQVNREGLREDNTGVISLSDRLLWLCISLSLFKRKTAEEIAEDGKEQGNMKLIPLESRFGKGLDNGDYINMLFEGKYAKITELQTLSMYQLDKLQNENTGFDIQIDMEQNIDVSKK